eukprot:1165127-Rhodomonas_salina.1
MSYGKSCWSDGTAREGGSGICYRSPGGAILSESALRARRVCGEIKGESLRARYKLDWHAMQRPLIAPRRFARALGAWYTDVGFDSLQTAASRDMV